MFAEFIGYQLQMRLYQPFLRTDTSFKLEADRPHLLLSSLIGHLLVILAAPPSKWHLCLQRDGKGLEVVRIVEE